MRSLLALCLLMCSAPVLAQEDEDKKKEEKSQYVLGFGYQQGRITSALSLNGPSEVTAGRTVLFGQVRSSLGLAYARTTYPQNKALRLDNHAFGFRGDLFNIFGFRPELGFDYEYLSEPVEVFTFEDTRIDSRRVQHSILLSVGGGFGSYDSVYIRVSAFGGAAYVENILDLYIDNEFTRLNRNAVRSGIPGLYGYRAEAGIYGRGLRLTGGGLMLFTRDAPQVVLEDQHLFFGTLSYTSPWYVGFYVKGQVSTADQSFSFLGNSVMFGLTVGNRID